MEWSGSNFAITPGCGYEMVTVSDTTWNPTEFANDGSKDMLFCRDQRAAISVGIGESTEPGRAHDRQVSAGVYFVKCTAGDFTAQEKLLLVK